jgi:hypothetical protein
MNELKYSACALALLVSLPVILTAQRGQENGVPLKNWATPLNWQPTHWGLLPALKFWAQPIPPWRIIRLWPPIFLRIAQVESGAASHRDGWSLELNQRRGRSYGDS